MMKPDLTRICCSLAREGRLSAATVNVLLLSERTLERTLALYTERVSEPTRVDLVRPRLGMVLHRRLGMVLH